MGKKTEGPQTVEVAEIESMSCGEPDGRLRMILIRESECSKKTLSSFTGLPLDNIYLSHWMITSVIWSYFAGEDNCELLAWYYAPPWLCPTSRWSSYVSLNKYKLAVFLQRQTFTISSLVGYLETCLRNHLVWETSMFYKDVNSLPVRDLVIWRAHYGLWPIWRFLCLFMDTHIVKVKSMTGKDKHQAKMVVTSWWEGGRGMWLEKGSQRFSFTCIFNLIWLTGT